MEVLHWIFEGGSCLSYGLLQGRVVKISQKALHKRWRASKHCGMVYSPSQELAKTFIDEI